MLARRTDQDVFDLKSKMSNFFRDQTRANWDLMEPINQSNNFTVC